MKLKLPKIKIFQKIFSLKYLQGLIIVILVGGFIMLGWFLYKNVYQVIAQSEEIILLRQEVAPDSIDMERVDRVLNILEKKITASEKANLESIKNPFGSPSP